MSKIEEAQSCHQQLKSAEEQLDLADEKVIVVEATSAEAAVRLKSELERFLKKCDSCHALTATTKHLAMVLHKMLEAITNKDSKFELENATRQKKYGKLSKTHAKTKTGLDKVR